MKLPAAARLTVSLAAAAVAEDTERIFVQWLEWLTPEEGEARLATSTSADLTRVTWRIDAEGTGVLGGLGDFLDQLGVPDSERAFLSAVGEAIEPPRLGGWIEMLDGVDGGWYLPVDVRIARAFAIVDPTDDLFTLQDWADRNQVERCTWIARAPARKKPFTEFHVPVSLDGALDALAAFQMPAPPERARAALAGNVELSIRITATGLTRLGVRVAKPTTEAVLGLSFSVEKHDPRRLAAFEGALAVEGASSAEYQVYADRREVELFYDLG